MFNVKLILSYNGSQYLGWQKNHTDPTIELAMERALTQILRHEVILQAASRTDAGVHAEGQVVNFYTPKELNLDQFQHSLNAVLPKEIRILSVSLAPDHFHPTLDNIGKEYSYQICNSPFQLPFFRHLSWHFYYPLDLGLMNRAISYLIGTHDFSSFCNARELWTRSSVCKLEQITLEPLANERLHIKIRGDHFLYKMVRNLVGTLAHVGCGKLQVDDIPIILSRKKRPLAGITAPAHGLCLKNVFYESNSEIC